MRPDGEPQPDDQLDDKLDELARFETHAAFSQLFCRLLSTWCREGGDDAMPLLRGFSRFLDAELWYHQTLADLGEREMVSPGDLRSVADKRRINLTSLAERLRAVEVTTSRATVVRHLLLAECHYHLRETRNVVSELEAAIANGGEHPLVHFALGYNRLDRAREKYASTQVSSDREALVLEDQFKTACLRSVDAFRDGLTGQTFDAWLYLYIGRALAAAGLVDEASAALETAARIDSSIFAQPSIVEELAAEMPESEIPVPEPPEPAPKVATEPI
ncbi:MAG TPA: hypothetical protein QGH10_05110, partial [Armatimonadota bacterium]|nr:hypothetical protein [Armatimonadota bacterium]